ncbi:ArnT family glycosyltransferase, partial [Chloroflexota bacterium]
IHRPWTTDQLTLLAKYFLDFGVAAITILIAAGLGRRLGGVSSAEPLERLALQTALGLGVLSLVIMLLGLAGMISATVLWISYSIGLVLLWRDIKTWLKEWRALWAGASKWNLLEWSALIFCLLVIGLNFFIALAPPLAWDSLAYHLELPRQYVQAARIIFLPENLYAGFPQVSEMLFTLCMGVGSVNAAIILGWMVGLIALIGVEGLARRVAGDRVRWMAMASLLTGFSISNTLVSSYVGLWGILFSTGTVIALDYHRKTSERHWLVWAGLMIGFSIGTKYTYGMLLLAGGVILLPVFNRAIARKTSFPHNGISIITKHHIRSFCVNVIILGGAAFLAFFPWLFKNFLLAGNPLYPILSSEAVVDPWRQTFGGEPSAGLWEIKNSLLLPIEATLFGLENAIVVGFPEYAAEIGPLILVLIPTLLLGWGEFKPSRRNNLRMFVIIAACGWLFWAIAAFAANQLIRTRHYYVFFPTFVVLAIAGYRSVLDMKVGQIRIGRVLGLLIALVFLLSAIDQVFAFAEVNPLPVIAGEQSRNEYIAQKLGWYGVSMQAINELPEEAGVLFLWEPRSYYCQVACYPDGRLHNWWYLRRAYGGPDSIADTMRENGITHILIYDAGVRLMRDQHHNEISDDWFVLEEFIENKLVLTRRFDDSYSIYELPSSP